VRRDVGVGPGDVRIAVVAPHPLEEDRAALLDLTRLHAAEQHLLVERDDQVHLVAAVGDAPGSQADAVPGRAGHAAGRRLDLRGDDLDGPDPVAGARGDRGERLAAALRPFARVAHDLDDVLLEARDALRGGRRLADQLGGHTTRTRAYSRCSDEMPKSAGPLPSR